MAKAILIGAGFSCDLGMPSAAELSKIFFKYFNYDVVKNYIIPQIRDFKPYGNDINLSNDAFNDILEILINNKETNYETFINKIERIEYKIPNENYLRTIQYFITIIYEKIYDFFINYHISRYPIYSIMKTTYSSFMDYLSKNKETWILSLNHDLMIEFLALDYNIPLKVGTSNEECYLLDNYKNKDKVIQFYKLNRDNYKIDKMDFFKNEFGINLIKLHGGLNEFSYGDNGNFNYGKNLLYVNYNICKHSEDYNLLIYQINKNMNYYINGMDRPIMREITAPCVDKDSYELLRKSMLTGGRKFSTTLSDDSGTSMYIFREILSRIDELDIVGYGFNDIHINDRIDQAMILNPKLKLNISKFDNTQIPHCIERHNYDKRIKYFNGFRTPYLFNYLVTNEQTHPEEEKLKSVLNFSKSQENYKNFISKYFFAEKKDESVLQYITDTMKIFQKFN